MIINIILVNDNIILINKVEQNKPKHQKNITNDTSTTSSIIQKQPLISGYLQRPMSQKDIPYLENLILRMCVSNGLPFSFIENEDTKAFFNFLAPGIELPTHKKLGEQILLNTSKNLQESIIKIAQSDENGVTVAVDGWSNVKQEKLWGVVLVTSNGKPLIWGAQETTSERSQTQDVIHHFENLMNELNDKNINTTAFISDSAGEYVAARCVIKITIDSNFTYITLIFTI